MKREELKDTIYSILFRQIDDGSADELIEATEEIAELFPLPPAEGAEEILRKPKYNSLKNLTLICEAMEEFATLHARQMAEKMVEEKLREELIAYDKWVGEKYIDNYRHEIAPAIVDEYLSQKNK